MAMVGSDLSVLASPVVSGCEDEGPPSVVFSFNGSRESAVLESAVLVSGFAATSVRSGFVLTGFAAKLSSSSDGFAPQHRNERKGAFFFGWFVSVRGEPASGVPLCVCFSDMLFGGCCCERLLLALLAALRLPVKLRFELFEPSLMLFDDPWTVSPLSPVVAEGRSSSVCAEDEGSCRLERFRRGAPSASTSRPLEEAEPDRRSFLRSSLESLFREDLRLGMRRCDEALELVRGSAPSVDGEEVVSRGWWMISAR